MIAVTTYDRGPSTGQAQYRLSGQAAEDLARTHLVGDLDPDLPVWAISIVVNVQPASGTVTDAWITVECGKKNRQGTLSRNIGYRRFPADPAVVREITSGLLSLP